jgi:hypothetical protein
MWWSGSKIGVAEAGTGKGMVGEAVCQAPGLLEGRLDPFHWFDGRGGVVQKFVFNLDWWPVTDLAVKPAMVEAADVLSRRDLAGR